MLYDSSEIKNLNRFNKKFIFIGIAIIIAIVIIIIFISSFSSNKDNHKNTIITAIDNSCTLEIPSGVSFEISNDNNFVIDLHSKKDDMFIYVSHIPKERMVDFYQIVQDDRETYISQKQNIRDDNEIKQTNINDYTAYEYSFVYYDSTYGKDFYNNILWIETEKSLYVLNFEVINDNIEKYSDIFLNIKNSFVEL